MRKWVREDRQLFKKTWAGNKEEKELKLQGSSLL